MQQKILHSIIWEIIRKGLWVVSWYFEYCVLGAWMVLFNVMADAFNGVYRILFGSNSKPEPKIDFNRPPCPRLVKQLERAKSLLEQKSGNRAAIGALLVLKDEKLQIRYFKDVSEYDFKKMLKDEDYEDLVKQKKTTYPPDKEAVTIIQKAVKGTVLGGRRIYISDAHRSDEAFTETLVHELSHYYRIKSGKEDHCEDFMDELRSFLVEDILRGKRITRARVQHYFNYIKEEYTDLKVPDKVTLPDDLCFGSNLIKP